MNLFCKGEGEKNPFCKWFYAAVSSSTSRDTLKIIFMYDILKNEWIICVIYLYNKIRKDNFVSFGAKKMIGGCGQYSFMASRP